MASDRVHAHPDGSARLRVRLTPNAARDAIVGWDFDAAGSSHLKCRVRAVPEKGKANAALIRLIARKLAIPKTRIAVLGGATARLKTLGIADGASHAQAFEVLLTGDGA